MPSLLLTTVLSSLPFPHHPCRHIPSFQCILLTLSLERGLLSNSTDARSRWDAIWLRLTHTLDIEALAQTASFPLWRTHVLNATRTSPPPLFFSQPTLNVPAILTSHDSVIRLHIWAFLLRGTNFSSILPFLTASFPIRREREESCVAMLMNLTHKGQSAN